MDSTSWLKQDKDKPLFPDLLWSRPENKSQAGKLLIVGGNVHSFVAPATAYKAAIDAGVGATRIILPESFKKVVGTSLPEAELAPSAPSGSLAKRALDILLDHANWADGVLLAGDFGRNSETAILLSSFLDKYNGQVTVAQDGLDYFLGPNSPLLNRLKTLSVINMGKLQKLAKNNRPDPAIKHAMNLSELVNVLNKWSTLVITKHQDNYIAAAEGKVSTTHSRKDTNWQIELAAYATVWWLQQTQKAFEALTSAVYSYDL